jgi:putative spermidine/putrescine transport system substrate-binding protein
VESKVVTRRQLLKRGALGGAGLALGPALAACGGGGGSTAAAEGAKDVTITFASWGGTYQKAQEKAWLDPYMKANPHVKILQDQPADYAKIKAQAESGNVTWDVCDVFDDFGLESSAKYLETIDLTVVENAANTVEVVQNTKYRVADCYSTTNLAWRTDKFKDGAPKNWADFFDLKTYPGKRGAWKWVSGGILEIALIADGVAPDKLYPLDVDRALRKLDTIKKDIVWWSSGSESEQVLADGEAAAAMIWNGRADAIQTQGSPIEYTWEQAMSSPLYLVVPKGTKNKAEAMKFIAYVVAAENNGRISQHIPYSSGYSNDKVEIPADRKDKMPAAHLDALWAKDDKWWDANFAMADEKFQGWVAS